MKIIAFTGRKENGKSTVCKMIMAAMESKNKPCVSINFKDPLLDMARSIGWNGEKDEKGRKLLQRLGTDVVRECIDQDYWVKKWVERVNAEPDAVILTDDVRFENEAKAVIDNRGMVVWINTPEINAANGIDPHKSEEGINHKYIDYSFTGVKFGSPHLQAVADEVVQTFLK